MTTMLPYNKQGEIDFAGLCFDPDDPPPLPDAMFQDEILQEMMHILSGRYTGMGRRPDVFLSSNTILCYDRNDLNVRVSPDCYLAFGVDKLAIRRRRLYLPWEVGKPPDLAIELASVTTARHDVTGKRRIYAEIGISEYWRFDPTGGDFYGEPLAGDRLVDGIYQPFELTTEPDGVLKGYSPLLDICLCWADEWLYFYVPATGEYIRNLPEEMAAREAAEASAEQARTEREAAEAIIAQERLGREAAEAIIAQERLGREAAEAIIAQERAARETAEVRLLALEEELRRLREAK
jgi:hypothetical protein